MLNKLKWRDRLSVLLPSLGAGCSIWHKDRLWVPCGVACWRDQHGAYLSLNEAVTFIAGAKKRSPENMPRPVLRPLTTITAKEVESIAKSVFRARKNIVVESTWGGFKATSPDPTGYHSLFFSTDRLSWWLDDGMPYGDIFDYPDFPVVIQALVGMKIDLYGLIESGWAVGDNPLPFPSPESIKIAHAE